MNASPTAPTAPTAVMAEDEPVLAQALHRELQALWPALRVLATARDGASAVQLALAHRPDMLFFDIRMPALSGLEAAAELADLWPQSCAFPLLVFVTAYDEYAVQAFEAQALDYVLKPVRPDRLAVTVERLKNRLQQRAAQPTDLDPLLAQLRALLHGQRASLTPAQPPLQLLQASVGAQLRMVPVDQVLRLEAADKYVRVFTLDGAEVLLRTPLKDLMQGLAAQVFWQIHRGSVVRAAAIESVTRDALGKLSLRVKGHSEPLPVSRLYAHQFKAM